MKIAYLSANPLLNLASPSGYGTHMREMIKGMRSLGHEVTPCIAGGTEIGTLAQPGTGSASKQLLRKIVPPYFWESAKDWRLNRFDAHLKSWFLEELAAAKPELIYERGTYLQLSGWATAQKLGVPYIVELNAPLAEEKAMLGRSSWYAKAAEHAERQLLVDATKVVVVSSRLVQHFSDKYRLSTDKFIITPNAVDLDKVKTHADRTTSLRKKFGLEGKIVLGFVGSIFPYHGVDLLIKAFAELATRPELHLMIVGDGETLPELKALAITLHLDDRITFTGNVPHADVFNHIALFDVAVLAKTKDYMSPIKLFEYGAMGVALIAPATTAVQDVIVDGEHGLLTGEGRGTLTDRLRELMESESLRKRIGKTFQQKVLTEHTWVRMAEKVMQ